jgi:alpha-L-fucosidase
LKTSGNLTRRRFLSSSTGALAGATLPAACASAKIHALSGFEGGAQRLSMNRLREFEALGYGMFIHFGMSTFVANEFPEGQDRPEVYAPESLDVDQWIAVARDAGMRYAVLTAKHVAGHCLWPSRCTDYTVEKSTDRTDVVEAFVEACARHGVLPGLYYCSWDNHHRLGCRTPSDQPGELPPYTTSLYESFQTAQITELLTQYGPIAEVWIDIPSILGRGYRTFLYEHIARLQPDAVVAMNSGISSQEVYDAESAFPSDLIVMETRLPPESGHRASRIIDNKKYYMPGEVCDTIGEKWFYFDGDKPRRDEDLLQRFESCKARGANLLLDVPPDKHGRIRGEHIHALERLRKNARL